MYDYTSILKLRFSCGVCWVLEANIFSNINITAFINVLWNLPFTLFCIFQECGNSVSLIYVLWFHLWYLPVRRWPKYLNFLHFNIRCLYFISLSPTLFLQSQHLLKDGIQVLLFSPFSSIDFVFHFFSLCVCS